MTAHFLFDESQSFVKIDKDTLLQLIPKYKPSRRPELLAFELVKITNEDEKYMNGYPYLRVCFHRNSDGFYDLKDFAFLFEDPTDQATFEKQKEQDNETN